MEKTDKMTEATIFDYDNRKENLNNIKQQVTANTQYNDFSSEWKRWFNSFVEGKVTLPFTYDPFFRYIFDPKGKSERLVRFISALLGEKVAAIKMELSREGSMITEYGVLVIMDIVVELVDGTIVNVEIQKVPYTFPAERISCYSSDLVMRQYLRNKRNDTEDFSYKDLNKVYTIVIFEKSIQAFHENNDYIYYGKMVFTPELNLNLLQEYCLVGLDVFKEYHYNEDTELTGWLAFLTTREIEEARKLVTRFPWLKELYDDAARLELNVKEVMGMVFSRELIEMDKNTSKLMIEELNDQVNSLVAEVEEYQKRESEYQRKEHEYQKRTEDLEHEIEKLKGELISKHNA